MGNKRDKSLGEVVRALRHKRGISQQILAEEAGLSMRTVANVEANIGTPTFLTMAKLAKALRTTLAALRRGR